MTELMTKEEFVEQLTIMFKRSRRGEVMGCKLKSEIGDDERVFSLAVEAFGKICVDDADDPVTRDDRGSHTPLYALDEIDAWKPGLFRKLSQLHWWIAPDDEINPLDAIEQATR